MPSGPSQDFTPKLFVVGRKNTLVSILLEILLEEEQNRFGVRSAGIEPAGRLHPGLKKFLASYETEGLDLSRLESTPISVALNDHVQLVAYTSGTVKDEGPIVATTGETLVLETGSFAEKLRGAEDPETFREVLDSMREQVVPDLLDPLGLNS